MSAENRTVRAVPGRLVDVGGLRLHVHCSGSGTPAVVMEAALGGSSISWSLVQPDIARLTLACSYDRAGFGWSDRRSRCPAPPDEWPTSFDCCWNARRFGRHSCSWDIPSAVWSCASSLPDYRADVAGLVLVDPAHPEDWVTPAPKEQIKIDRGMRLCRRGSDGRTVWRRASRERARHAGPLRRRARPGESREPRRPLTRRRRHPGARSGSSHPRRGNPCGSSGHRKSSSKPSAARSRRSRRAPPKRSRPRETGMATCRS